MRRASLLFLAGAAAALAVLASALSASAQEEGANTFAGRVVNGTAGGGPVEGLPVALQAFNQGQEVRRWEGTAGPDGSVSFSGIDTSEGLTYFLSTAYQEVRYFSDPVSLAAPPTEPVELRVFETTEDANAIRIVADSTVVLGPDGESGTMRVMQVTTFLNATDRAFIGSQGANGRLTVQVPLPPRAFEVTAAHDATSLVNLDGGAVFSTFPVLPGMEDLIVTYRVLYVGEEYEWSKEFSYPVEQVRLLVAQGLPVEPGRGFQPQGPAEINGGVFFRYDALSTDAGTRLTARIAGLPTSTGVKSRRLESTLRLIGIGVAATAVLGAAGYAGLWSVRRRRRVAATTAPAADPAVEREESLERLAQLEDEFEAGNLSQQDYDRRRDAERARLRRLLEEGGR